MFFVIIELFMIVNSRIFRYYIYIHIIFRMKRGKYCICPMQF